MKGSGDEPVAGNEFFVTLLQAAREDEALRVTLLKILRLDAFHRRSLLSTQVREMIRHGAPARFAEAVGYLTDDAVAVKARALLENG